MILNLQHKLFLIDSFPDHKNFSSLIDEFFIEEVAAQKVLRFYLEYKAAHENKIINVWPVKTFGRSKEKRMYDTLSPFMQNKKVFLQAKQTALIDQIIRFPFTKNDDLLDALAYVPQVIYDAGKVRPKPVANPPGSFDAMLKEHKHDTEEGSGIRPRNYSDVTTS